MSDSEETKKCPYCSELILATAKKCKHCGEWLEESNERKGTAWNEKGTADARAVTKGIKQKEQDDFNQGCAIFVVLVAAIVVGTGASSLFNSSKAGWIIGSIIFIAGGVWATKSYFEE
jgi:predicted ATP-dependent serine protease